MAVDVEVDLVAIAARIGQGGQFSDSQKIFRGKKGQRFFVRDPDTGLDFCADIVKQSGQHKL